MMRSPLILLLLIATACRPGSEGPPPWEEHARSPKVPALPPDRALNLYPFYRYKDPVSENEYYVRGYEDEYIVTVKEPREGERFAAIEEKLMVMARMEAEWANLNDHEKIEDLRRRKRLQHERNRHDLDETIAGKEDLVRQKKERLKRIESKISSSKEAGLRSPDLLAYMDEERALREEIDREQDDLAVLRNKKQTVDRVMDRKILDYDIETVKVDDLLAKYATWDTFVQDLKDHVPVEWDRPPARMELSGRYLVIVHERTVIDRIQARLRELRGER